MRGLDVRGFATVLSGSLWRRRTAVHTVQWTVTNILLLLPTRPLCSKVTLTQKPAQQPTGVLGQTIVV